MFLKVDACGCEEFAGRLARQNAIFMIIGVDEAELVSADDVIVRCVLEIVSHMFGDKLPMAAYDRVKKGRDECVVTIQFVNGKLMSGHLSCKLIREGDVEWKGPRGQNMPALDFRRPVGAKMSDV